MKRILPILFLLLSSVGYAQQFSCPEIYTTIDRWNALHQQYKSDVMKWCQAIIDTKEYRVNSAGEIEYEYVIHSADTFDIAKIKDLTFEFIQTRFNLGNEGRKNLVQGSTDNTIYFKGTITDLAHNTVFLSTYYFNATCIFNFKFKENRLKMTVTIPTFMYHIGEYVNTYTFFTLDPFVDYNYRKNDGCKEAHARAMINGLSNALNYPDLYLKYLNQKYTAEVGDDW